MITVIGVKFKDAGRVYYFDPKDKSPKKGSFVVVETARGAECGEVTQERKEVGNEEVIKPLKSILRIATDEDVKKMKENKRKEAEALAICEKKVAEHKLDMKLTQVEYAFDSSKIIFYFTADGRVDFRELVKDLAGIFHTRIELRQIGVRDEAKMLGGLGICGQPFCCSRFLDDFQPVSIKMAKEQGLSLNPTKISGCCGRLMCCLKYEQNAYEYLNKITPRQGSIVMTPDGRGLVVDASPLTGKLKVKIGDETMPRTFGRDEVKVIKNGRTNDKKSSNDNGSKKA